MKLQTKKVKAHHFKDMRHFLPVKLLLQTTQYAKKANPHEVYTELLKKNGLSTCTTYIEALKP